MIRLLVVMLVTMFPTLLFGALIVWFLGSHGYAPLQPMAATIQNVAAPFIEPIKITVLNLVRSLFGR